jgi:hypothetical protein
MAPSLLTAPGNPVRGGLPLDTTDNTTSPFFVLQRRGTMVEALQTCMAARLKTKKGEE